MPSFRIDLSIFRRLRRGKPRPSHTRPAVRPAPKPLIPKGFKIVERYSIYEPFAHVIIAQNPDTGETKYLVDELKLSRREKFIYDRVVETLQWELKPLSDVEEDPYEYFKKMAKRAVYKYRLRLGRLPGVSWSKILYYVERDLLGYGPIDPLMRDPNLEDISCDGVGKPVYVWHRRYESIPTNIYFESAEELDEYVMRLAHKAGKHISVAWPILDAMLPGMHRLAATFSKEVSTSGSTFTIRKFREDPITIIDMINFGTLDPGTAAYLWLAMEYKMPAMVMGVTGAGKSVSGRSRVLAVVEGVPGVYSVEEIWDKLSHRAVKIGEMEVIEEPDILIRSLDPSGTRIVWARPRFFIRHRNDRKMYRVALASGRYVDVTEDHSLIIRDEGGFRLATPRDDIVGSRVPVPRLPLEQASPSLGTVLSLLDLHGVEAVDPGTGSRVEWGSAGAVGFPEDSGDLLVSARQGRSLMLLETLVRPEFAELLGYYAAKGHRDQCRAVISSGRAGRVAELCEALGEPCRVIRRDEEPPQVLVEGTLGRLVLAACTREEKIPPIYWVMPPAWRARFLRAYTEAKGRIGPGVLGIAVSSEELAWELVYAFSELGVMAVLREGKAGGRRYEVLVPAYSYEGLAGPGITTAAGVAMSSGEAARAVAVAAGGGAVYLGLRLGGGSVAGHSEEASLSFDEIVDVYEVEADEYVYDFEVPGTQSFEANNIVVHNTTLLNALACLFRPTLKIVTIEDTPELRIPLDNWVQLVSRPSYGTGPEKAGEVTLFDLVKVALRYRPDIIMVGEVRGEEAYVLFQALATGHGGLTSIHAETVDAAVKRLTSPPMNIPEGYIPLMKLGVIVKRVRIYSPEYPAGRIARRVTGVYEIRDVGRYEPVVLWDPFKDRFNRRLDDSMILSEVSESIGMSYEDLLSEMARRSTVLEWMAWRRIRDYKEVARVVQSYYANPEKVFKHAEAELAERPTR